VKVCFSASVSAELSRTSLTPSATTAPALFWDSWSLALLPWVRAYEPRLTQVPAPAFWSRVTSVVVPSDLVTVYFAAVAAPVTLGYLT
jgi:hypothetical protein